MGKNGVEGVMDADPRDHPDARLLPELTHLEAIERGLKVMDATALSLCMDNHVPMYVFNLDDERTSSGSCAASGSGRREHRRARIPAEVAR